MTFRLHLIAHAETAATRRAAFSDDEGLTPRGFEDALSLARQVPRLAVAWTSPAAAARETVVVLGSPAETDDDLRDIDVGTWRGRALAELVETDPSATAWIDDPRYTGHGGESIEALITRIEGWLAARRALSGIAVAVTHAAVLRAALVATLGAPATSFWRIDVPPLAILTLGSDGRRWALRGLNTQRADH